jgi:lipopolysaccharide assembly outer membrane protein LptD (OstA)
MPFFSPAGTLTHRMVAKRGVMVGNVQHLQEVALVYFSATEPDRVIQKVTAMEATWDDKKEILTGDGPIVVATETTRLTGEGFDFTLATSRLYIRRNFAMTNDEILLTSDRAEVDLITERSGDTVKFRDVKRSEAIGNLRVVVQPQAKKTYPFERATSERAVYEGASGRILFPEQVRYVRKGREIVSNTFEINLGSATTDPAK